jgi:hypothetical protein
MVRLPIWTDDVDGFVTDFEPLPNEWQQNTILFFIAVEQGAHVAYVGQVGASERNWSHMSLHMTLF